MSLAYSCAFNIAVARLSVAAMSNEPTVSLAAHSSQLGTFFPLIHNL
jgi:hypothetical protein